MSPKVIIILAIIAFAAVLVFVLVLPQWRAVQDMRTRVAIQRQDAERIEQEFSAVKDTVAKFKVLEEQEKGRVFSALPPAPELPDLYILIDSLVTSSGLISKDITISIQESVEVASTGQPQSGTVIPTLLESAGSKGVGAKDVGSAVITVSALGEYEALKGFLRSLEQSLRILDIHNINFEAPKSLPEGGFEPFLFSVKVRTYFKRAAARI